MTHTHVQSQGKDWNTNGAMAGELAPLLFTHLLKLPGGCKLEPNSFETYAPQPLTVLHGLLKIVGATFCLVTDSAARPVNQPPTVLHR